MKKGWITGCWLLLALLCAAMPDALRAQAVIDTSMNRVIADSVRPATTGVIVEDIPLATPVDSASLIHPPFQPIPKKSALYSAILPGAGQFYNRQYWKIPVIYVGVGFAAYFLIYNTEQYRGYRQAYVSRLGNPTYEDDFTQVGTASRRTQDLKTLQDFYRKQLDLTILLTGIGYTLQVLDALTFAHLKNFDISKDISLRMQPVALPTGDPGLGLVMRF